LSSPSTTYDLTPRYPPLFWWVATFTWAGFIFFMSTRVFGSSWTEWILREALRLLHLKLSPHAFSIVHFLVRKSAHLTEYSIFAFFLYGGLGYHRQFAWQARTALHCILIGAAYSLTDEFHQHFVPGRGPSLIDCGIDTVGATLAMLFLYLYGAPRFYLGTPRKAPAGVENTPDHDRSEEEFSSTHALGPKP